MNAQFKNLKDVATVLKQYQLEGRPMNLEEMRQEEMVISEVMTTVTRLLDLTQAHKCATPEVQLLRLKLRTAIG